MLLYLFQEFALTFVKRESFMQGVTTNIFTIVCTTMVVSPVVVSMLLRHVIGPSHVTVMAKWFDNSLSAQSGHHFMCKRAPDHNHS